MITKLYKIFNCIIRDDGRNTLHSRTIYILQGVISWLYFSIFEIVMGLLNLRSQNYTPYIIVVGICMTLGYFTVKTFDESRGQKIIDENKNLSKKEKIRYRFIASFLLLASFISMFLGGYIMSYFLSLYE
jgi:hypothetical protein